MDYDYWLTKSYLDAQEVTQEQFKEFCVEKAVEALPDGMYRLRSLGKKGRTHRIGYFTVYRKNTYPDETTANPADA